ncbi:aspartate/glutamate racemase family protein [Ruania albidiflava]|uniref:aspartate/glutamate racemase family protein n=1 Tax=Ruania albidiflava TaxID=366586 RepID=UPI0003B3106D|nr:amino acid racemase [Ruania albidiflava]
MSAQALPDDPAAAQLVIGVLGGMGPAATAHFQTRLVELTDATRDRDHPTVVTWSDPGVPDRVAALRGTGPSPVPVLRAGLGVLTAAGAQVLTVPCNTVHPFLPEALEGFDQLHLVDMIQAAAEEVAGAGMSTVAVLATAATLEHGMYARALGERAVRAHSPGAGTQPAVLELIAAVKAGTPVRGLVGEYRRLVAELAEAQCDGVLVACSEISAVAAAAAGEGAQLSLPSVDAVDSLVRVALRAAGFIPKA